MHIHDIIIVGGGISGLFLAYNLIQDNKYKDILLVESSSELGGRIRTEKIDDIPLEMGAARFSSNHVKLLSLIEMLGYEDKILKLPGKIDHIYHNKKITYTLDRVLKKLTDNKKNYQKKYLEKITLFQYSSEILGYEEAKQLQEMFGYDAEFLKLNAYSALTMFNRDLLGEVSYYILNGGLSQLITKLELICNESKNIEIRKNVLVKDLQDKKIKVEIDGKGDTLRALKIVSTMPYIETRKMDIFKDYEYIHSVKPIPLIRIYAKYPVIKGKSWFHNLNRTITDNYIRHIIPIDHDNGIIMISYTDFYNAEMWNNYYQLGEKVLTERLHIEIYKLFKIKPPTPLKYKVYYWRGGVHMWRTRYPMDQTYQKLLKPFEEKEIYLSNEAFCKHQCWIEGSLDMATDVLKLLKVKSIKVKKISLIQDGGKNETSKNETSKRKNKDYKQYDIKSVVRRKNWIIFEHGGKKWIYKISPSWFDGHPGGNDRLKEGVEANTYYDKSNKERSSKSPTQLFKSIGVHGSSNVFKEYILEEKYPSRIKIIGLLK